MRSYLVPAALIGVVWVFITNRPALDSFVLGFVLGYSVLLLVRPRRVNLRWRKLPLQGLALLIYTLILMRDIFLSGLDVTRRVLSRTMPLNLGIIAVDTQDSQHKALIAALSADVITLTPGELVVEIEDNHTMYVHCLDVEASRRRARQQQALRLVLFMQIMGNSDE
jgi:multisubunit Na+/H+ antiporter MnhE subunit